MRWDAFLLLAAACLTGACGSDQSPVAPTPSGGPTSSAGSNAQLSVQGDPESAQGATWTYRGTVDGVSVDLQGILLKPRGSGPFPAVIISHGAGGNANGYSRGVAMDMVSWGLVCIASNYTHAAGVPVGAPGTSNEPGASQPNILRARATREILRTLGYVDLSRLAAHGHSMGAFVTAGLVAAYSQDFRVASHTAGGMRPDTSEGAAPTESQARGIRTPYQCHHGDVDTVVPLAMDQRLSAILQDAGVPTELHVYRGASHNDVARDATVLTRIRAWYAAHGLF